MLVTWIGKLTLHAAPESVQKQGTSHFLKAESFTRTNLDGTVKAIEPAEGSARAEFRLLNRNAQAFIAALGTDEDGSPITDRAALAANVERILSAGSFEFPDGSREPRNKPLDILSLILGSPEGEATEAEAEAEAEAPAKGKGK